MKREREKEKEKKVEPEKEKKVEPEKEKSAESIPPEPSYSPKMTDTIRHQYVLAVKNFLSVSKQIEDQLIVFEEREKKWKELETKMKENVAKAKTKVTLNVGGKKFATSKSTLTSQKDSYFDAMISSGHWEPDEDGEYFIDRDPKFFQTIINFLRNGTINLKEWNQDDLERLKIELDYYQIVLPTPPILPGWWKEYCGIGITLNGLVATKTGPRGWNSGVLWPLENPPYYKVKIVTAGLFMVGLAPKATFTPNGTNYNNGWYFYSLNGSLHSKAKDSNKAYASAVTIGETIEVFYDQSKSTIRFSINGISQGVAFNNVTADDLYPAIDFQVKGTSIEMVI